VGLPRRERYATDCFGFVGRFYLEKDLGHRVCQIYSDSRTWDTAAYPPGFFDSVLIDGGHQKEIVLNDTAKAWELLRPGGLMLWHDFCPPLWPELPHTRGVMEAVLDRWEFLRDQTRSLFWIYPSYILLGIKQ
jgi:predicted O-methyltransferase YrrM